MSAKRPDLELTGVRLDPSHLKALKELAEKDPDPERVTVSTLIRRAVREYLERQGKLRK